VSTFRPAAQQKDQLESAIDSTIALYKLLVVAAIMFSRRSNSADSDWGSGSSDNSSVLSSDREGDDSGRNDSGSSSWSLLRRRGGASGHDDDDHRRNSKERHHSHSHKRGRHRYTTSLGCRICAAVTVGWLTFVAYGFVVRRRTAPSPIASNPALPIRERTKVRTEAAAGQQKQEKQKPALSDLKRKKKSGEDLDPGCERPDWQEYNFPNCNDVHEIDLASVLAFSSKNDDDNNLGYVASGLWRSVWAVNPRAVMSQPIVMKIMEMEHDVNTRNFDRHRRDAIVMERLTSSPYVVDGYGFCGNTVMTEFLDLPLDKVVMEDETDRLESSTKGESVTTPITSRMRIQWAIDVAKGMQALHEIEGGPIVHADVQAKQFLVSPATGIVKVNDFNRCRFMARNTEDGSPCPFHIPSAPGKMRAPEEYKYSKLDEKLDMYSVANVLYSILTQEKAWDDYSSSETKSMVKKGTLPTIEVADKTMPKAVREALVELNHRAYALDPKKRISASELASELEKLLEQL